MLCSCPLPRPPLLKRPQGPLRGKEGNQRPLGHKETRSALFESEPQTGQETGGRQGDWEGVRDRPRGGEERRMQRPGGRAEGGERRRETREGLRGSWAGGGRGGRALGCATWAALTWAALTWAGLTGLRGGHGQSRAWLLRTVFVPRRSAFPWAGGAPCRPRRVARQSAQPRPRKAHLGPACPLALQEKLRPRDRTAGPVQRQDRGRAPGWLCGRGCLPGAGRSPEGAERGPLPRRRPPPPAGPPGRTRVATRKASSAAVK